MSEFHLKGKKAFVVLLSQIQGTGSIPLFHIDDFTMGMFKCKYSAVYSFFYCQNKQCYLWE